MWVARGGQSGVAVEMGSIIIERVMGDLGYSYIRLVHWKESLEYCCSDLLAVVETTAGGALVD